MSTTIYNTGKTSAANIFGNVARRTVTTNSYAEILSQTVDKKPADMTPDEYKSYFAKNYQQPLASFWQALELIKPASFCAGAAHR